MAAGRPDVARLLLGEPTATELGGDTLRYRTRGSLAVHVGGDRRGTWRDFEADVSGGTLALIEHFNGCDKDADGPVVAPGAPWTRVGRSGRADGAGAHESGAAGAGPAGAPAET